MLGIPFFTTPRSWITIEDIHNFTRYLSKRTIFNRVKLLRLYKGLKIRVLGKLNTAKTDAHLPHICDFWSYGKFWDFIRKSEIQIFIQKPARKILANSVDLGVPKGRARAIFYMMKFETSFNPYRLLALLMRRMSNCLTVRMTTKRNCWSIWLTNCWDMVTITQSKCEILFICENFIQKLYYYIVRPDW